MIYDHIGLLKGHDYRKCGHSKREAKSLSPAGKGGRRSHGHLPPTPSCPYPACLRAQFPTCGTHPGCEGCVKIARRKAQAVGLRCENALGRTPTELTVYLDNSVVLRALFHATNPLKLWANWDKAFSSSLWRVEALRTVDRLRLSGDLSDEEVADLASDLRIVHETLAIQPLSDPILQRASESFPPVVGTLDALHLSTALAIAEFEKFDLILTHDLRLGTAARSLGFEVPGIR